jgi:hypothetical protein
MLIKLNGVGTVGPAPVSIRCPSCRQIGVFQPIPNLSDLQTMLNTGSTTLGHRSCPDPNCNTHVFVVRQGGRILVSYPAERIDFDSTSLPPEVVKALEEAITCHANNCHTAAAIMIRKTLEVLCDAKQAQGNNLKARIADLGTRVILPTELLEGLDNLRLLGNDAAHIESTTYNDIGETEVELAIDITKEVLKAVYQYANLVNRLAALKRNPGTS